MSLWTITSPSDAVTIRSDDFQQVALVISILGNGMYSAKEVVDENPRIVPFFTEDSFQGWFAEKFSMSYEESALNADKDALADILETMIVGPASERAAADAELAAIRNPKGRKIAQRKINKKRASKGWHIFEYAEKWVYKLREGAAEDRRRYPAK